MSTQYHPLRFLVGGILLEEWLLVGDLGLDLTDKFASMVFKGTFGYEVIVILAIVARTHPLATLLLST